MSDIVQMIILGVVQGLTEFLPVSSSGHLELSKYFLGSHFEGGDNLMVTVILHIATACSTCVVFRKEIAKLIAGLFDRSGGAESRAYIYKIVISMIPAAFVGFFFEDAIDVLFEGKYVFVAMMLLVTAALLTAVHFAKKSDGPLSYTKAFIIGVAQAIAITPGISRSGSTIATSLLLNVSRAEAARFSFLMVVPLIFGKVAKDLLFGMPSLNGLNTTALLAGSVAAFISGIFACKWMVSLVSKVRLLHFAVYCTIVSISFLIYYYTHQA